MQAALKSEGTVNGVIKESPDGHYFLTAYAPVKNKDGNTVGLLGLDYIVDDVMTSLSAIVKRIIIIGVVLAIVSVGVAIILANGILYGLGKVHDKVRDLVENDGDLTQHIEVKGNDEVSDIAKSINELLEHIRGVVSSISDSSNKLSGSVDVALDSTIKTNDQLDGVAATMEEMSALWKSRLLHFSRFRLLQTRSKTM